MLVQHDLQANQQAHEQLARMMNILEQQQQQQTNAWTRAQAQQRMQTAQPA